MARGLAADRHQAEALLLAGEVRVGSGDGARTDHKPGEQLAHDVTLAIVERPRFVSRGGEKLDAALDAFGIDVTGRICLDVGASTGGFTDCLLRRGAARVYALDVGRGQLAESLRACARVVSLERTHAARLAADHPAHVALPEPVSLAVIDVSFIPLERILRPVQTPLAPGGEIVALVKPQFELPADRVPRGVVRETDDRRAAIDAVRAHAADVGLVVRGEIESPLRGPKGNVEYLLHLVSG